MTSSGLPSRRSALTPLSSKTNNQPGGTGSPAHASEQGCRPVSFAKGVPMKEALFFCRVIITAGFCVTVLGVAMFSVWPSTGILPVIVFSVLVAFGVLLACIGSIMIVVIAYDERKAHHYTANIDGVKQDVPPTKEEIYAHYRRSIRGKKKEDSCEK